MKSEQLTQTIENENMRDVILLTAAKLFVSLGYHGVGMREIAAESGASKALLYYHFQNKEDLFLMILSQPLTAIGDLVDAAQKQGGNTREKITFVFKGLAAWAPEQRAIISLAKQEIKHISETQRLAFMVKYHDIFIGQVQEMIRTGMENGEIRTGDPVLVSQILLGMSSPVLTPGWFGEDPLVTMDTILTCFFDGVSTI